MRPVVGFSAAKRILDWHVKRKTKADLPSAGLAPWRFHDLRRTATTGMAGRRVAEILSGQDAAGAALRAGGGQGPAALAR